MTLPSGPLMSPLSLGEVLICGLESFSSQNGLQFIRGDKLGITNGGHFQTHELGIEAREAHWQEGMKKLSLPGSNSFWTHESIPIKFFMISLYPFNISLIVKLIGVSVLITCLLFLSNRN